MAQRWYNLRQDEIGLPDGNQATYTIVEHPGSVWIVPLTTDGKLALIHHYRYTVDDWCWEIPAGGLAAGVEPQEMARRELLEEIGGRAEQLHAVTRFYTNNGISSEVAHLFLATGVTLGEPEREATEIMNVQLFAVEEVLRMAREGEVSDGPSALCLMLCSERLLGI